MSKGKKGLIALFGVLPASGLKNFVLRRLGLRIGKGSSIGPSLILGVDEFVMGENSRLGPGNVLRGLAAFRMGDHSNLGQWNWVSAAPELIADGSPGTFEIGNHSTVTSRHYVDASGGVAIGNFVAVAGVRSTFVTHGADWRTGLLRTSPITVGDYSMLSSNTSLTPGTVVGNNVITGMGSTLAGKLDEEFGLYYEPRALLARAGLTGGWFTREVGYIDTVSVAQAKALKDRA